METDPNFLKMLLDISSKDSEDLINLCDSSKALRAYCKKNRTLNERYTDAVAKKNLDKLISKYVEELEPKKQEDIISDTLMRLDKLIKKKIENPYKKSVYNIKPEIIDTIVAAVAFHIVLSTLNYVPKDEKTQEIIFKDRVEGNKPYTQALHRFFIQYFKNKYNASSVFEKDPDEELYA